MSSPKRIKFRGATYVLAEEGYYFGPEHLYHGTTDKKLAEIEKSGGTIRAPSYWGSEDVAWAVAEVTEEEEGGEAVVLRVPISRFDRSKLQPDKNAIAEPFTYTLGMDEDELWEEWEDSDKDWEDCVRIYGSAKYTKPIKVSSDDLP